VWLRDEGNGHIQVLVEIDGQWRVAIKEYTGPMEGTFSHIAEGNGKDKWPIDEVTKGV